MPFKFNADGTIAVDAEKKLPIFIHPNGTEAAFDADTTLGTITRLNGEAKTHREGKEAAEAKLKSFEGIEDGVAALAALNTVKSLSSGELKTAAQVKEIQDAAAKTAQEQVAAQAKASATQMQELTAQLEKRTSELNNHMIGGSFASSKLLTDDKNPMRLVVPAEMARAYFGNNFKVEEGKIVPYDAAGNKIFRRRALVRLPISMKASPSLCRPVHSRIRSFAVRAHRAAAQSLAPAQAVLVASKSRVLSSMLWTLRRAPAQ